ncbi:hypothetical protein AB0J52_41510 [Spirillospora sp. NPDC049652]
MSDDPWTGPPCQDCEGKGSRVLVGRSWIEIRCETCGGSGSAGPRDIPPMTEEFDADEHVCEECGALKIRPGGVWRCPNGHSPPLVGEGE